MLDHRSRSTKPPKVGEHHVEYCPSDPKLVLLPAGGAYNKGWVGACGGQTIHAKEVWSGLNHKCGVGLWGAGRGGVFRTPTTQI